MPLTFRAARREDLETLVATLADDPLGAQREDASLPTPVAYVAAFERIDEDPHQQLLIAQERTASEGTIIRGFLQLTFIPYLTYRGGWRAQVEGVRVAPTARGHGVGQALMEEAIRRAVMKGCHVVQLTTDKARPRAKLFYERLGFEATHEGMKRHL